MPEIIKGITKRQVLEALLFGERSLRRFTQDSAVLPDVWIKYGEDLNSRLDLLLTPYKDISSGKVALLVEKLVKKEESQKSWKRKHNDPEDKGPSIAYNQSTVAIKLYFDEMVRVVLPMTSWWFQYINKKEKKLSSILSNDVFRKTTIRLLDVMAEAKTAEEIEKKRISPEFLWLIKIAGTLEYARTQPIEKEEDLVKLKGEKIFDSFVAIARGLQELGASSSYCIYTVSRNREATVAIFRSVLSVKADAARSVFKTGGKGITWAVIDSGSDSEMIEYPFIFNHKGKRYLCIAAMVTENPRLAWLFLNKNER